MTHVLTVQSLSNYYYKRSLFTPLMEVYYVILSPSPDYYWSGGGRVVLTEGSLHPALYQTRLERSRVACHLCPVECILSDQKIGVCRGKKNIDGTLYAINYGLTTALAIDPIEKKPLYNFFPGSSILSIGPNGCNLKCNFCQNFHISQETSITTAVTPERIVDMAIAKNCVGVAYTYTEPLIWFEYVLDTAKVVRDAGLVNVLVTNGEINPEPFEELLPYIDAMNIDIKSMDPLFYKKVCKASLDPVLATVTRAAADTHVEITNLVIPGLNDTDEMFHKLTDFVASINPLIPVHFSRYHSDYKQSAPQTPYGTLDRAARIASQKLKHVYIGNVGKESRNQTHCPGCGEVVISRAGYQVIGIELDRGNCRSCAAATGVVTR